VRRRSRSAEACRLWRRLALDAWRLHRWVYRWSGGRIGGHLAGMPVLLLTTRGRRSGRPHTTTLTYLPDGRAFVVIASNGGAPRHPDWFLNLRAHPEAQVEVGARRLSVQAREAEGPERDRLWALVVQRYGGYAVYQRRTRRRIPVVVLTAAAR
jgi:deazaflavin-dependent oxidoreductase (nitroreductase family)